MEIKHTKGEWKIDHLQNGAVNTVVKSPKKIVAKIYRNMSLYELNANAKLIAAAPDLLKALQFCQSVIKTQGMFDLSERMAFDKAAAAIKKATL